MLIKYRKKYIGEECLDIVYIDIVGTKWVTKLCGQEEYVLAAHTVCTMVCASAQN